MGDDDTSPDSGVPVEPVNRRRALQLAAAGSGAMLAGCGGDSGDGGDGGDPTTTAGGTTTDSTPGFDPGDDEDGTQTEEPTRTEITTDVDQDFMFPVYRGTDDLDYHSFHKGGNFVWDNLTYEVGVWGPWAHPAYYGVGDLHLQQYADVVSEDDRLEITVRDDAYWSNGEPVTGRDAIAAVIYDRLSQAAKPFDAVEADGPAQARDAVTDYTLDGKTAILHSDGGYFGEIVEQNVWHDLLLEDGPRRWSRDEYFGELTDRLFEQMDRAVAGEVDPWSESGMNSGDIEDELFGEPQSDQHAQLREYFRQPDNIIVNGAWTVDDIRGQRSIVFRPNEHHRNADDINYNKIVMKVAQPANSIYQGLNTKIFDMAGREMAPPEPHIASAFPDLYDRHLIRNSTGRGVEICHSQPYVGDVRVRQAMLAALDKPVLCETAHEQAYEPIQVPSGDYWGLPQFLSDEWMGETFQDYSHDTELAAELMREGGYERDSNQHWVDGDGKRVAAPLYTPASSPGVLQVIVKQLNEFGIDSQIQTIDPNIYESEKDSGDLPMWGGSANAGFAYPAIAGYTAGNASYKYAHWHKNVMRRYAFFDGPVEQNIRETSWNEAGWPTTQDPDELEHLTVSAPPIGDFWAGQDDWEARPVLSMSYRLNNAVGEEAEELWRDLLWINNWHLPGLPWANTHSIYFVNTQNWIWPTDREHWHYLNTSSNLTHESYFGWGDAVYANPENPK